MRLPKFACLRAAALGVLVCCCAPSWAQVYKCTGPDGVVEYTNTPGNPKNSGTCRPMNSQTISTIPAPSIPKQTPREASGSNFPKVAPSAQKARDADRRAILSEEFDKEKQRLSALMAEYNNGQPERLGSERNYQKYLDRVERLKTDIARAEANLVMIRRELDAASKR